MCHLHMGLFRGGINRYPPVLGRVGTSTVNGTEVAYDESTMRVAKTADYCPVKDVLTGRTPERFG